MLSETLRTLLIPQNEAPPLEAVVQETGARLRRGGRDAFTLVCPDGSTATVNFWRFERPQDFVTKSVMSIGARFRKHPLEGDAARRRTRILLRAQSSKVVVVVGVREGSLGKQALDFVRRLATRTDALVYDGTSLRDARGETLVDVDGHVTEVVPDDYPALPGMPKRPELDVWTEKPFVLVWVPEEEALRANLGTSARILTEESRAHRKELVARILDLNERVSRVKVPPEAQDRRTRLSFEVVRATALVEGPDVPGIAARLHGVSFVGAEARDELGRLVLSTSGAHDPRALSPAELLILHRGATAETLRAVGERLSSKGLTVRPLDRLERRRSRIESQAMELVDMPIRLGRRARARHERIVEYATGSPAGLRVSADRPMDLEQLGEALSSARALRGVTFDGWGFYDHRGRALLVRSGAFDPAARFLTDRV